MPNLFVSTRLRTWCKRIGKAGENDAVKLLLYRGCSILARNFRIKSGELDIVARDGAILVFVEVKTRFLHPHAKVMPEPYHNLSSAQKLRIYRGALRYLHALPEELDDRRFRFDLIEVVRTRFRPVRILHHVGYMGYQRGCSPFEIPIRTYHRQPYTNALTQRFLGDE